MGLRGFVDAWGAPVKREGFTRPALAEPANAGTNNSAKPIKSAKPEPIISAKPVDVPVPAQAAIAPRGRGRPKQVDAAPWVEAGVSRRTYYRQQAAKAKD